MVEFVVRGIALEKESQMPLALLQEKGGETILPLWLGPSEASSIIVEMEGVQPPRLLTHDLLAFLFNRHGYRMKKLEIYGDVDEKYFSRLHYTKGFRRYSVEVRPSDGIALALRLGAPILGDPLLLRAPSGDVYKVTDEILSSEILYLEPEYKEKPWV
jgi:hypothetical protein